MIASLIEKGFFSTLRRFSRFALRPRTTPFLILLSAIFLSANIASADLSFVPETSGNDTAGAATPLVGSTVVAEGSIYPNADVDFYSFSAQAGDRVFAAVMTSISSSASTDSTLTLIDTDGATTIEFDEDDGTFGGLSSSIAGATLPLAGTYYLRIAHFSATGQLRPYRLFLEVKSGTPDAEVEPNDAVGQQTLPSSGWVSGSTSSALDLDLYSINLNAGDTLFLSLDLDPERDATEWNGQLGVGLFGSPGNFIAINDAGSSTPDSEAVFITVKDAGVYQVLVNVPGGGVTFGTYLLNAAVIPGAAATSNCTTYTSTDVPQIIPTGPGTVSSTITVPGNPRIADINVELNITHDFMTDLDVQLISPAGNDNGLFTDIGSSSAGVQTEMNVLFDDEASSQPAFSIINGMSLVPELNYRLAWYDGENAGGVWTLQIYDDLAANGGTLNGWSIVLCEPEPATGCATGTEEVTVFSTDFESDNGGFTHSGVSDEWEWGLPTYGTVSSCNSGTGCWATDLDNTYDASSAQDLLSPAINLAGLVAPVTVTWAQRYQIENATFDHIFIDVQEVGGANPSRLFEWQGSTMTNSVGNPAATIQESAGWGVFSKNADFFAGLNSELRFHLDSDTTVQHPGLAIDDVSVTACRALDADLSITKSDGTDEAIAGLPVTYTITATNAGPDDVTDGKVTDIFPASCETVEWTCAGSGGAACFAASGSGDINDVSAIPAGGSVTYTAICTLASDATGDLANTATVVSAANDADTANNTATDTDTILPAASGVCKRRTATIVGTSGDDIINGTSGADVIVGLGGNDTINGGGGNDIICGGDGNDRIKGNGGKDKIYGDAGNDRLIGGGANDRIIGGSGNDRLSGGGGRDRCIGGGGRDRAKGCETVRSVP